MKRYLPAVLAACFGFCAGFGLCYLCLVLPHREGKTTASAPRQDKTVIAITRDGGVYLAGKSLDIDQLAPRLKELGAKTRLIIRTDSTADWRRVVEVLDACKAAGVRPVSVASVIAP